MPSKSKPSSNGKPAKLTTAQQQAILEHLTQQAAAWLIGRAPSWMRDNPHLFERHEDGTYDARSLVGAAQVSSKPPELPDRELEPLLQLAEDIAHCDMLEDSMPAAVRILEGVERSHGLPGMAAFAYLVLEHCRYKLKLFGSRYANATPSACHDRREVCRCEDCGRYRWGRQWIEGQSPAGYVDSGMTCPACKKKQQRMSA